MRLRGGSGSASGADVGEADVGEAEAVLLTCKATSSGTVEFSNGCGGYDLTKALWNLVRASDPSLGQGCECDTEFGGTYRESGKIKDYSACAQAICTGGSFNFEECRFSGSVVSTGLWRGAVVTVPLQPLDYLSNICSQREAQSALEVEAGFTSMLTCGQLATACQGHASSALIKKACPFTCGDLSFVPLRMMETVNY